MLGRQTWSQRRKGGAPARGVGQRATYRCTGKFMGFLVARFVEASQAVVRAWHHVREPSYRLRRLSHCLDDHFAE